MPHLARLKYPKCLRRIGLNTAIESHAVDLKPWTLRTCVKTRGTDGRVALAPVLFPDHDQGAPGRSLLETGIEAGGQVLAMLPGSPGSGFSDPGYFKISIIRPQPYSHTK